MTQPLLASLRLATSLFALAGLCYECSATEFRFGTQTITVPDGYTVELAAAPPLTDRPIMGDFDQRGRLFIAEASGTNDDIQKQLKDKPHSVLCLEDTDGDGVFDQRTVFADKMMFPAGVLCYRGSVYVAAPPSIWKLTDSNGDGVADKREEWLDAKTLTGCANDLHGPYLGHDGWIYWCKGAFAEQTYPRSQGAPFVTRAAHIFRQRPGGSEIEPVMTGGMDNPVEVAFSPSGERFFTSTFVQHPGGGRRDGLMHAIYGGVYGKNHDVIDGHPRTSENLMPIMTHLGNAAACALEWVDSDALGMQGDLLASLFNLRKITRHQLTPWYSTFRAEDSDFLVSDSIDFHPTDIVEDADGSLLVIDTGGWYKLCCPTSQLHKPDVLGAIYRVRKTVAAASSSSSSKIEDPRGLSMDWPQAIVPSIHSLIDLLDDSRPEVRKRAIDELALSGSVEVVNSLGKVLADEGRNRLKCLGAIWALCRIDSPEARAATRAILLSSTVPVRIAALHAAAVWRDKEALPGVTRNLGCPSASVRRAAAEAAGRMGDSSCIPELFAAIEDAMDDPILMHSLVFALIEIADPAQTRIGLNSNTELVKIAALTALDQMRPESEIQPGDVVPLLFSESAALRDVAWRIAGQRDEWSGEIAAIVESNADSSVARKKLPELADLSGIQERVGEWSKRSDALGRLGLHVINTAEIGVIPDTWLAVLHEQSKESSSDRQLAALQALTRTPLSNDSPHIAEIRKRLVEFAEAEGQDSQTVSIRMRAAARAVKQGETISDILAALAIRGITSEHAAIRRDAGQVLSSAALSSEQCSKLIDTLPSVSPLDLANILPTLSAEALKALPHLTTHPGLGTVPEKVLREFLELVPDAERAAFIEKTGIFRDSAAMATQLEETLKGLSAGDVVRGQAVFNSSKAMCTLCHEIGYLGGDLGPDLTRIGTIRSRRDLLEAIMFPSASTVRSYETVIVTHTDQTETLGIVRSDNSAALVLATAPETEIRIPRDKIQSISPAKTSLMPAGMHLILTQQELSDLLAFLENTRWR